MHALTAGYHLSTFFAWFLTIGTYILLLQFGRISLNDLARHNHIEHDASLAHQNSEYEAEYAPCEVDDSLLAALCEDAKTPGRVSARLNSEDIARARVRRERESPLDGVHAEVARGEMAIALGVFGGTNGSKEGIPVKWLKEWIKDERLPQGWNYTHTQGFFETIKTSGDIRSAMKRLVEKQESSAIETVAKTVSDNDSPSASSSQGSLFVASETQDTTPQTSDSEEDEEKASVMSAEY